MSNADPYTPSPPDNSQGVISTPTGGTPNGPGAPVSPIVWAALAGGGLLLVYVLGKVLSK